MNVSEPVLDRKKSNSDTLKKITTLVICLTPILCIYKFTNIFLLGEVVLIFLFILNFLYSPFEKKLSEKQVAVFLFAIVIFFISFWGYLISSFNLSVVSRLIRLMFCLIMGAVIGGHFFDYQFAKKCIIIIAVIATVLIFYQRIYHDITGDYIYFLWKENIYASVYDESYFLRVEELSVYRPMSVFLEPSHYCQYMLFALVISLFQIKNTIRSVFISVFFTIGIIISTSSTGAIVGLVLWVIYLIRLSKDILKRKKVGRKARVMFACILIGMLIVGQFISNQSFYAFDRIYSGDGSTVTSAWDGRLGTFSLLFDYENWFEFLFGRGYGIINEEEWYASIPYYFSGTGLLGMIAIILFFFCFYYNSNKIQKKFLFIFFILCFVSEVLMNYWLVFIIPLLLRGGEEETL